MCDDAIFSAKAKRTIGLALNEWGLIYHQQLDALSPEDDLCVELENEIAYIGSLMEWIDSLPTKTAPPIDDTQSS